MGTQKIAISSDVDSLNGQIDQRFGRCRYFVVVEVTDKDIKEVKAVVEAGRSSYTMVDILDDMVIDVTIAHPKEVKAIAKHVTAASGGRGAVREAIEHLLKAMGRWDAVIERYQA